MASWKTVLQTIMWKCQISSYPEMYPCSKEAKSLMGFLKKKKKERNHRKFLKHQQSYVIELSSNTRRSQKRNCFQTDFADIFQKAYSMEPLQRLFVTLRRWLFNYFSIQELSSFENYYKNLLSFFITHRYLQ